MDVHPIWVFAAVAALPRAAIAVPSLEALRVDDRAITADGRLDEPEWARAAVGAGFLERSPRSGAVPPVATEVRVLHDRGALYVAVTMSLLPGETPRALEMTRDDTNIWSDDAVTIKLDIQHDRRSTVGFAVNPAGAQLDFVALDGGRSMRLEFDALWECGTRTTDGAWIAEFRLPFAALGLSPSTDDRLVGLQVSRDHNARRATYDWSPMPPEFGPFSALHYGILRGIQESSGGRPLSLIPYVLYATPATGSELGLGLQAGGDVRFRLAPDLWSEITVLTDFAQADVDDQVLNLSRFPLRLPEKRQFFLAGLDAFEFGHPQSSAAQLFFSRRIGLDDEGREVPILAGMKHYGRVGPLTLGVLDVVTLASGDSPAANWAVARLDAEVARDFELGAIGTARNDVASIEAGDEPGGAVPGNFAGGLDTSLVTAGGRLQWTGFVAASASGEPDPESGTAARAALAWKGEEIQPELSVLHVSDHFNPAIGFVRQAGLTQVSLDLPWKTRAPTPWLDEVGFETVVSVDGTDELDRVLARGLEPTIWLQLRSGWTATLGAELAEELVEAPFELVPGVEIQPARYRSRVAFAALDTPSSGNPSAHLVCATGDGNYGGRFDKLAGSAALALTRHLRLSVNADLYWISLPGEERFSTQAVNARATIAVSTNLFADVIAGSSSVNRSGVLYARVRWRYRPGSDVFLVYREAVALREPWTSERSLVLKISARFDAVL